MQYKLYRYTLERRDGRPLPSGQHFDVFNSSKGYDPFGRSAKYRGRDNALLMYIQKYGVDFGGLIGRHSTEREVTQYNQREDKASTVPVEDDDYPNVAFLCFPRMQMVACVDGSSITASSAISRLHAILSQRKQLIFVAQPLLENVDLRRAVKRFRVTEVTFEILPVNPHTGDLGLLLDENRKKDAIQKIVGRLEASKAKPLQLNGGFLEQIQQLQQSGHGRVGFEGYDDRGTLIQVPKPKSPKPLREEEDEAAAGAEQQIKIELPSTREAFPFGREHVNYIKQICIAFNDGNEN
jgi:hypothetical protein